MPWHVEKRSGDRPWKIVKDDGTVVGSSKTEAEAKASVRARYANTPEASATAQRYLRRKR